jgi:mRNA guanylyltransferase
MTPNHVSTVEKVLQSIDDAVSEDDLMSAVEYIKDGWDRRHPEDVRKRMAQAQLRRHQR